MLQEGVSHYEKYINQMLADAGGEDLPMVMACMEMGLRSLKENYPEALPLMNTLTSGMGAITTVQWVKEDAET